MTAAAQPGSTGRAVGWMLLALLGFCLLAIASRELTHSMNTLDILFWRSLLGVTIVSCLLARAGALHEVRQSRRLLGLHALRNSSHFGGQCAWLIAIAALPMAEVFALEFTTPLWSALLAAVFLRERLNAGRMLSLLLGLVGVLVILRPGVVALNPASLIMLAGAIGFGVSIIVTRSLTIELRHSKQAYLLILFYMTAMQMVFSLVAIAGAPAPPQGFEWAWMLVAAVTALSAHYCLSRALGLADAAVVMPIDYLRLPLIMVLAWALYAEQVSIAVLLGAGLIIAGNGVSLYLESRRIRRQLELDPLHP